MPPGYSEPTTTPKRKRQSASEDHFRRDVPGAAEVAVLPGCHRRGHRRLGRARGGGQGRDRPRRRGRAGGHRGRAGRPARRGPVAAHDEGRLLPWRAGALQRRGRNRPGAVGHPRQVAGRAGAPVARRRGARRGARLRLDRWRRALRGGRGGGAAGGERAHRGENERLGSHRAHAHSRRGRRRRRAAGGRAGGDRRFPGCSGGFPRPLRCRRSTPGDPRAGAAAAAVRGGAGAARIRAPTRRCRR